MSQELKPCPFCGGKALPAEVEQIEHSGWVGRIECEECDAVLSHQYSFNSPGKAGTEAIAAWNKRAQPAGEAEPVAWVRFCSDGCYEGPIMNSSPKMDEVRKKSGAWTPLYAHAARPASHSLRRESMTTDKTGLHEAELTALVDALIAATSANQIKAVLVPCLHAARWRGYHAALTPPRQMVADSAQADAMVGGKA